MIGNNKIHKFLTKKFNKNMKKFFNKSFVDYAGVKRIVTVCIKSDDLTGGYSLGWALQNPKDTIQDSELAQKIAEARASYKIDVEKLNHDMEKAEADGKPTSLPIANYILKNPDNVVSALHTGFLKAFENEIVDFILQKYLNYLIDNPGIMLGGYNLKKRQHLEKQRAEEQLSQMNAEDLSRMVLLAKSSKDSIASAKKLYKYYAEQNKQ